MIQIGVGANIGRVLAAKFEAKPEELTDRRGLHRLAAGNRAGEVDLVDTTRSDDRGSLRMIQDEVLEQTVRQFCATECFGEAFADQQGLRGVLQDHAVAGHQGWNYRIDGGEVRIIPGCDDQDSAERLAFHLAFESCLGSGIDCGERFGRYRDHVAGTFFEAAQFASAVANRAAHLPGQFGHDLLAHRHHRIDRRSANGGAFRQRYAFPSGLRLAGGIQRALDVGRLGAVALRVNPAVDRRDQLHLRTHGFLSIVQSRAGVPNR